MNDTILELKNITKDFPGVRALDEVSLTFRKGEVHAIAGENGAGKSTFIKIITGAIQPTKGSIIFDGKEIRDNSPAFSMRMGITAIYQEFNLFSSLSVAENIFYGRYPVNKGVIDYHKMYEQTDMLMGRLGVSIPGTALVKDLSVGFQQIVEIAKAVYGDAKLIIMDEPSAPLTEKEVGSLMQIIRTLKADGITIIYISHRLEEIFEVCDRVSVFRDGRYISTSDVKETDTDQLIRLMVNRELGNQYPEKDYQKGAKVLEVSGLNTDILKDISFEAYEGEILGLAGLVGAGRTEIARAIFGADKISSGKIYLKGEELHVKQPMDAIRAGIGLIPEDRKRHGIFLKDSVRRNITFARLKSICRGGFLNTKPEKEAAEKFVELLGIKTPTYEQLVGNLSGGNQQKVVLAKWLFSDSRVLIFDEPTRGIDVGAKQEIYRLMVDLVKQGKTVIMISSDLPEMIGMADRIIVLHEGRISGMIEKSEYSQEKIMTYASGIRSEGGAA